MNLLYKHKFGISVIFGFILLQTISSIVFLDVKFFSMKYFIPFSIQLTSIVAISLILILLNYDKIKFKDKKLILFSLVCLVILVTYRYYQLLDFKYWEVFENLASSIDLILTPLLYLLLLIGFRRIIK